jgi:microcystin degradation protein MlrC
VRNVDDDLDAYDALVALGYRTVPVTVAGTRTIVGYRPDQLAAARQAAARLYHQLAGQENAGKEVAADAR